MFAAGRRDGDGAGRAGARATRGAARPGRRAAGRSLALAETLSLGSGEESPRGCWRVAAGRRGLPLVEGLRELAETGERRCWSSGRTRTGWWRWAAWAGATCACRWRTGATGSPSRVARRWPSSREAVPLSKLMVAIRERAPLRPRCWPPGSRGASRRRPAGARGSPAHRRVPPAALARADAVTFQRDGALQISVVRAIRSTIWSRTRRSSRRGRSFRSCGGACARAKTRTAAPAALASALRPYQRRGSTGWSVWRTGVRARSSPTRWAWGRRVQTLAVLSHRAPLGPALVVAPTSVVSNWVGEAARFVPELRVHRLPRPRARGGAGGPRRRATWC